MKMNKNLLSLIISAVMILQLAAGAVIYADEGDEPSDHAFILSLFKGEDPEFRYDPNASVINSITLSTGFEDKLKTYFIIGNTRGGYSNGSQTFDNGSYSGGTWTYDFDALSEHTTSALMIYEKNLQKLTVAERMRARSMISCAFDVLPLEYRMGIANAPDWLADGICAFDAEVTFAENCDIVYEGMSSAGVGMPENGGFPASSKKARNDRPGYSHYLICNPYSTTVDPFIRISVPAGAEVFYSELAIDSTAARAYSASIIEDYVKVALIYADESESVSGRYYICKGYENKIAIETQGAEYVEIRFSRLRSGNRNVLLGNAMFLTPAAPNGTVAAPLSSAFLNGDIDGNGIINSRDVDVLKSVIVGGSNALTTVCDVNGDNSVDYADLLVIGNYIAYLENLTYRHAAPNPSLNVISLGDSIATGLGLDTSESSFGSTQAYGGLFADRLADSLPYNVVFTNYGVDEATTGYLAEQIGTDFAPSDAAPINQAIVDADLILISIGGNDVFGIVKRTLKEKIGADFDDPSTFGGINYADLMRLLTNRDVSRAIADSVSDYTETMKGILDEIYTVNPSATVAVTTIPVAITNTNVVYQLPILGKITLLNLYDLASGWIEYYNSVIRNKFGAEYGDNLVIVDESDTFDASNDLVQMIAPDEILLNDLDSVMNGGVSFDVHPSAKGHVLMAENHVIALEGTIAKLESSYYAPVYPSAEYAYTTCDKSTEIRVAGDAIYDADTGKIRYTVTVTPKNTIDNLYVEIRFDDSMICLDGVVSDGTTDTSVSGNQSGICRILLSQTLIAGKSYAVVFTFSLLPGVYGGLSLDCSASTAVYTNEGNSSYSGSVQSVVNVPEPEPDPDPDPVPDPVPDPDPDDDPPSPTVTDIAGSDEPDTDQPGADEPGEISLQEGTGDSSDNQNVTVIDTNKRNNLAAYIIIGAAAAAICAGIVITAISLKNKNKKK